LLYLTPQDLLRLGELSLHFGNRGGRQVVPESWLRAALVEGISAVTPAGELGRYGYHWWLHQTQNDLSYAVARGYASQRVAIARSIGAVIVITSDFTEEVLKLTDATNSVIELMLERIAAHTP
jgi:hypothetical protein